MNKKPLTLAELEKHAATCAGSAYGLAAIREDTLKRLIAQAPQMARRIAELEAENTRLRADMAQAATRIAEQKELLEKRAEKQPEGT